MSQSFQQVSRSQKAGFEVVIESVQGCANYHDAEYEAAGATVGTSSDALACETIITIRFPGVEGMKEGTNLACVSIHSAIPIRQRLSCIQYHTPINGHDSTTFESSQSMDVNSSQDNLAGYKAVYSVQPTFQRASMMTTSAGTVRPAKVVIMGSGVAGLQAIATAKRLVLSYSIRRTEISSRTNRICWWSIHRS